MPPRRRVLAFGLGGDAPPPTDLVALGSGGLGLAVGLTEGGLPAAWGPAAPAALPTWPPPDDAVGAAPTAVAAAPDTVLALTPCTVHAAGWAGDGLMGLEEGASSPPYSAWARVPLPLPPTLTLTSISAGEGHALALDSAGRVWAWGCDAEGQVGLLASSSCAVASPTCVLGPGSVRGGPPCAAVAAGGRHSLALAAAVAPRPPSSRPKAPSPPPSHPPVYAWGWAGRGQCGSGDGGGAPPSPPAPRLRAPTPIPGLAGLPAPVTALAAGLAHSLFLAGGGVYWCGAAWAAPAEGGVGAGGGGGTGSTPPAGDTDTPALVAGGLLDSAGPAGDVSAIAAGGRHSLALTAGGAVVAWGCGRQGGLGEGWQRDGDEGAGSGGGVGPVTLVAGGALSVAAGRWHSLVVVEE